MMKSVSSAWRSGFGLRVAAVHLLVAGGVEGVDDLLDQRRVIAGEDAERIAHLVVQPGAVKGELVMARLLLRIVAAEPAIDQVLRGKRVFT